jgi:hypothetical protein
MYVEGPSRKKDLIRRWQLEKWELRRGNIKILLEQSVLNHSGGESGGRGQHITGEANISMERP